MSVRVKHFFPFPFQSCSSAGRKTKMSYNNLKHLKSHRAIYVDFYERADLMEALYNVKDEVKDDDQLDFMSYLESNQESSAEIIKLLRFYDANKNFIFFRFFAVCCCLFLLLIFVVIRFYYCLSLLVSTGLH